MKETRVRCIRCHQPLTDPESIRMGFGPKCRRQIRAASNDSMLHVLQISILSASFPISTQDAITVAVRAIRDALCELRVIR